MSRNKKYFLILVIGVVFLALSLSGCGGQSSTKVQEAKKETEAVTNAAKTVDPLQALYEKAKEEGQVNFWGPVDPPQIVEIAKAFNKEFPGIKVDPFEIRVEAAIDKIIMESAAGKTTADVVAARLSDATLNLLLERNMLVSHNELSKLFGFPADFVKEDGKLVLLYTLASPVSYNTDLISKDELPKTWEDLLDPKWKGKIILETRGKAVSVLAIPWGVDKTVEFARKLADQNPFYHAGGSTAANQLASGLAPLAVGNYAFHLNMVNKKAGKKLIDWVPISPIGVEPFAVYTLTDSPHSNAAKLFMGWLATDRGQEAFVAATGYGIGLKGAGSSLEAIKEMEAAGVEQILINKDNDALYAAAQKQIQDIFAGKR